MGQNKPKLMVIAGPNGSGKTSVTSQILKHKWVEGCIYINPDNIAQDQFGDWNSPEAVLKAAQLATTQREDCLKNGESFIFETVFSAVDKVDFLKRAKDAGFFVRLFFVGTNHPSINASRVARRVMEGAIAGGKLLETNKTLRNSVFILRNSAVKNQLIHISH